MPDVFHLKNKIPLIMITVHCPICKRAVVWSDDNPWRPFCSQACKTRDLGSWATESYRIKTEEPADTQWDTNNTNGFNTD